jgi:hypothetical protein
MAVEAPRYINYAFARQEKSVEMEKTQSQRRSFLEYGSVAGRPESSEGYWVPVDWMAWKLLVDILKIPPKMVK